MNRSAQGDDLTAMRQLAALHDDAATFDSWLRDRLGVTRSSGGVVLSTVHRVKGQEWPHVVVHHADAEQYPHRLAEDVEEERRLFHVAITRASIHATIVTGPGSQPVRRRADHRTVSDRVVSSHRADRRRRAAPAAPKPGDPDAELDAEAAARFDRLKELRTELRPGSPPTSCSTTRLSPRLPDGADDQQELSRISGVGPAKLDKYGDAFIELITTLV